MSSKFVVITKGEFEGFLPENFSIVDEPTSKEIIYEYPTKNPKLKMRIFSSVDVRTNDTREIGSDAIRCVLIDAKSSKPLDKGKRTHRMSNWRERLKQKLDDLQQDVDKVHFCNVCGSAMARRTAKNGGGEFYGCVRFPLCMTTRSISGTYKTKTPMTEEDDNPPEPKKFVSCPRCGAEMRKRSGRLGEFYGCSKFPGCRGTRQKNDVEIYGQGVEEKSTEVVDEAPVAEKLTKTRIQFAENEKVDMPTDDSEVQLIDSKKFPHLGFKFEKFNPVQSRVFNYYDQDINLIVAAATSAGKTAIAEMLMSESISKNRKAVFLSPLKAVSQEKNDDWNDDTHDWSKKNVSIVTGDYTLTEKRVQELNEANVIIMTTEMMDSRTRRIKTEKNDWLLQVGTVVLDESHLIAMNGRGDKVESAIMRFTKQNPSCRIVFLSATMPNVSQLAKWLTHLNGKKTELINSNYRPCQLDLHHVAYDDIGRYQQKEVNKMNKAIEITQQYQDDKFIIFVHTKNTGRNIYRQLNGMGENVELHNAELSLKDRIRVSESFKKRDGIRIIVATSTLAWGINLPARRVIVVGVHRGLSEVEPLDIKQEAGRAGRVGFDPKGDAYILLPRREFEYYKNWCANIPPITSTMNDHGILAFHIVSEVSEGEVTTVETLMDWYNRSLAAFQNDFLDRVDAQSLLDDLTKINILEKNGDFYKISKLGRVAAHLYFSPYTIAGWCFNFNKIFEKGLGKDDLAVSWALANIKDNLTNFVPKEYKEDVTDYKRRCNLQGLNVADGTAWIGYCFESCLKYSDIVRPEIKNQVKFDIERTITAIEMIDNRCTSWNKGNYWQKLQTRVQYEISWDQTQLCSLKGIGGVLVRDLFEAEITSIEQFRRNSEAAISAIGKTRYGRIFDINNL